MTIPQLLSRCSIEPNHISFNIEEYIKELVNSSLLKTLINDFPQLKECHFSYNKRISTLNLSLNEYRISGNIHNDYLDEMILSRIIFEMLIDLLKSNGIK